MDWNKWVRQTHRWLSIVFTMTVVANFAAMALENPPMRLVYSSELCRFYRELVEVAIFEEIGLPSQSNVHPILDSVADFVYHLIISSA
jgi:cellulose synthase/poly-beta-1,6-N-acetylglucosamine synthase-like glycosyltransferase